MFALRQIQDERPLSFVVSPYQGSEDAKLSEYQPLPLWERTEVRGFTLIPSTGPTLSGLSMKSELRTGPTFSHRGKRGCWPHR